MRSFRLLGTIGDVIETGRGGASRRTTRSEQDPCPPCKGEKREMTSGQGNVVEDALEECARQFTRGVHSFAQPSDLTIDAGVVDALKGELRHTFEEHLNPESETARRDWQSDKEHVLPMAFYTGALAACYAHNAIGGTNKRVTEARAKHALQHVSAHCHGPEVREASDTSSDDLGARWWYCPPW